MAGSAWSVRYSPQSAHLSIDYLPSSVSMTVAGGIRLPRSLDHPVEHGLDAAGAVHPRRLEDRKRLRRPAELVVGENGDDPDRVLAAFADLTGSARDRTVDLDDVPGVAVVRALVDLLAVRGGDQAKPRRRPRIS